MLCYSLGIRLGPRFSHLGKGFGGFFLLDFCLGSGSGSCWPPKTHVSFLVCVLEESVWFRYHFSFKYLIAKSPVFGGTFLRKNLISSVHRELFGFSVSSWVSFRNLCLSRSVCVSCRLGTQLFTGPLLVLFISVIGLLISAAPFSFLLLVIWMFSFFPGQSDRLVDFVDLSKEPTFGVLNFYSCFSSP